MQPGRRHPFKASPALVALLLLAAPALASDVAPAPTNLDGTYDPDTEVFTLTWDWSPDDPVDAFRVFIDGTAAGDVTDQEYEDDLDGFAGGTRTYQVAAIVDMEQGQLSNEYTMLFSPGDPIIPCELLGTSLDLDDMPPLGIALHPECLPPVPFEGDS